MTPIRPSLRIATVGNSAWTLGTLLISTGALQVKPPSSEREKAMPSRAPPEKRESCQAMASAPLLSTATEPRFEPSRIGVPVSGLPVPRDSDWAMVIGADQLAPLSSERMTRSRTVVWLFASSNSEKNNSSVPSGRTTIWLLSVELVVPPGS